MRLLARALVTLAVALLAQPLAAQQPAAEDRVLRPGDILELFHWRDSLLNGEFPVEQDGRVILPILGPRQVADLPWAPIRDSIRAAYARELRAGDLRITPKRRVFVLGFVQEPGVHFADPTTTLAGAIALAGGASPEGDLSRLRVVRNGRVLAERVSIESATVADDVWSGDQIFVGRRGWFDRNSAFMVSAIVGLAGIVVTLIVSQ